MHGEAQVLDLAVQPLHALLFDRLRDRRCANLAVWHPVSWLPPVSVGVEPACLAPESSETGAYLQVPPSDTAACRELNVHRPARSKRRTKSEF